MAPGETSHERPLSMLLRTLASSVDGNPGQALLTGLLVPYGATCVLVHAVRGHHLALVAHAGVREEVAEHYAAIPLTTRQPMTEALVDGRDRTLSAEQWESAFPLAALLSRSMEGARPTMTVRVFRRGGVPAGTLAIGFRERPTTSGELHERTDFLADALALWSGPGRQPAVTATAATTISPRQREVIALVSEGRTNPQIADALHVSVATVKADLAALYALVGAQGRGDLPARAIRAGL